MTKKEFARGLAHFFGRLGVGICDVGATIMPFSLLYGFARIIAWIGYKIAAKQRRIAVESLAKAFNGEKTPAEIEHIARECFYAMAGTAVEFFMFMRHPERIRKYVEVQGLENLDRALGHGKGVVGVSAHFGSFPLLVSRLAMDGYKVSTMIRHIRDPKLDELFEKKRDMMRVGSIYTQPREQCVNRSLEILRNNEILFIQLDQNFGTAGVFVDFFGTKAATATGPVVFSMRTGAPLVPMFIYRLKGPRHKIVIEPEYKMKTEGSKHEIMVDAIQALTALIEKYIRKYPHEWGWIHKRWKARPKEEREAVTEVDDLSR